MSDTVTGLIIGFAVGVVVLSVLMFVAVRRARQQSAGRLASQEETISDLRQELAEDKENNRRLRHELHSASQSAGSGVRGSGSPEADGLEHKLDLVTAERDDAMVELSEVRMTLESTRSRLADRETKLAEYREAVKQIRMSLEGQENLGDIISVTQDVPANAPAGE